MGKNILSAAERIEAKFGGKWEPAGSGILKPPAAISTGSLLMDEAIGDCKGYPEGSVIEVYGPQHSGKTLMGYLAIASSQRKNPKRPNIIIDAENQFRFQSRWAQKLGVDVSKLFIKPVITGEEAFDILEMIILGDVELNADGEVKRVVTPGDYGIIMVDSVTQLVPLELIHKGMDESQRMGLVAAMMSKGLKKILSAMILAQSKTIIFFINQTRMDPNAAKFHRNPESRTGGTALPFYDTISFRVSKISKSEERDDRGKIFAHQAKIKFDKNKVGGLPADPIVIRIRYDGVGIDQNAELFSVAEMNGLIKPIKKGRFNFIKPGTEDELVDESIDSFKQEDFQEVLNEHPNFKQMIIQFIQQGKFYFQKDVQEDNPEVSELSNVPAIEDKVVEKVEVVGRDEVLEPKQASEVVESVVPESVTESDTKLRRRRKTE